MNPIYVIIFVVMLDHGYMADPEPNVIHKCDPLAMNIAKTKSGRVGLDADNQAFPIRAFLYKKKADYYVARATATYETSDSRNSSRKFCQVPYLERSCGPLRNTITFLEAYDKNYDLRDGLFGIKFHISMVGMSLQSGRAIQYEMDVVGINPDDYIFQWIEGTAITAHEIDENGLKVEVRQIPDRILQRLKSEFAIHAIHLDVSPPDEDFKDDDTKNADDEEHNDIDRIFAIFISCDGQSIWASYNKWVVDHDFEGNSAFAMDKKIFELQEAVEKLGLLKGDYPNVKPISTYMPERFDPAA